MDKMLEYQEIDTKIYREELSLLRSPENQKLGSIGGQINNAQQTLLKLDKETEDLFREIEKSEAKLAELNKQDKTNYSFASVTSLSQIDNIEKALNSYAEELASLEREIKKSFKRLSDINAEASRSYEAGMSLKNEYMKVRTELAKKTEEIRERYKEQNNALNELKKNIEPNLLASYKVLRDNRKMPAFVPYENSSCKGCGMNIQVEVDAKLRNPGDTAECPNCRRIVYKQ